MAGLQDAVLSEWHKKYPDISVKQKLQSGKEADLWLVETQEKPYVLKVYVGTQLSTRATYTEGQWIREASLRKAIKQKSKVGKNLQQRLWTKREYHLLKKLYEQGAIVPEVFACTDNAILMQYLGNEQQPAPRLIDVALGKPIKRQTLSKIEQTIQLLLDNGIVHGDLSPYNVLWWDDKPWIIDFPQAVDIRHNPNWRELYERDLRNIRKYFH
ncbi:MAG TPA: RIO1 family regulatory kinase/ATPase [Candidatus Saccharimonadales bacterium]|jgi:RIO kinase 1